MFSTLANWIFGCSHRRTGFPITRRIQRGLGPNESRRAETYVVCLECGAHLAYDWSRMRMAGQSIGAEKSIRAQREGRARRRRLPTANRWLGRLVHHA
jgi:hypothetical protein